MTDIVQNERLSRIYDNALQIYSNNVENGHFKNENKESRHELMVKSIEHAKELEMVLYDVEYKKPTMVFDVIFNSEQLCYYLKIDNELIELHFYRIDNINNFRCWTRMEENIRSVLYQHFKEISEPKGYGLYNIYVNHPLGVYFKFEINIHRQTKYIKDFKVGRYDEKSRQYHS